MKCRSKKIVDGSGVERIGREKLRAKLYTLNAKPAFSLIESVTALIILALVSSSVLVVINRCMASAADLTLRMQAFEVARENMETLLSADSVKEMAEYGSSDKYPEIQWQIVVETFYEPLASRMWIQAICSAEYTDTAGEVQTVELTHWLTDLTKKQLMEILEEKQKEKEQLAEQIIETEQEAAEYADVDEQTIQQWVENGMPKTEDGYYIKNQLDLYKWSDGNPSVEDRSRQAQADAELIGPTEQQDKQDEGEQRPTEQPDVKRIHGYTREELEQMSFEQLWKIFFSN